MVIGLAVRAFTQAAKYLKKPITLGAVATVAAVPVAVSVVDHETDGALSMATIDLLKDAVKKGASPQAIERTINGLDYVIAVSNTFDKAAQNLYVEGRMNRKEGNEAVLAGKQAAVEFQLLPQNVTTVTAKHGVRILIADDLFKGDRNAADKYLANSLIDDIVKNAQVSTLGENQVIREDVRKTLNEALRNPEKHPIASKFLNGQGQLMNGLTQIWPELSAPAAAPSVTLKAEEERENDTSLTSIFGRAADGEGGMMKVFAFFIAMIMQALGLGKNDEPDTDNKVKRQSAPPTPTPRPNF